MSIDTKLTRATQIAEGSMSAFEKFQESMSEKEMTEALQTIKDSVSADILATISVMLVLQALVADNALSKHEYAKLLSEMCLNEGKAITAAKVMMLIHMERLNGKDYFNGKEI